MVKQPKTVDAPQGGPQKARSDARQERLEAALRENLKRRKQQTRARSSSNVASKSTEPDGRGSPQIDSDDDS